MKERWADIHWWERAAWALIVASTLAFVWAQLTGRW
jgi:hypothetical protein